MNAALKIWLAHKAHVIYKGHGYEEKKQLFDYVKKHLEYSNYSNKMIVVMKEKLFNLLPHESNRSFKNQKEILETILENIQHDTKTNSGTIAI